MGVSSLETIDGKIRAFVCVSPGPGESDELFSFMDGLRRFDGYKWVRPEGLHVTLKFLGDVSGEQIQMLDTNLSRIGGVGPFYIKASGPGAFPNLDRPSTIWLGVREGAPSLEKLARSVEAAARKSGFPEERKKFRAHVTLARAREERNLPEDLKTELESLPALSWTCRGFTLMRSVLAPQGAIYTPIREYRLD
jgi:2'-5' RNA ligase